MLRDVKAPKWGLTVTEVTVIAWNVDIGDHVEAGAPLCAVEAEKVDAEIDAPVGGVLVKTLVDVGGTINPGDTVAVLEIDA